MNLTIDQEQVLESRNAIDKTFDWALRYTRSFTHTCNEYHNDGHCSFVANKAIACWRYSNRSSAVVPVELILAGMFHDVEHSGGRASDEDNIAAALEVWNEASQHPMVSHVDAHLVALLIRVTQYNPDGFKYKHPKEICDLVGGYDAKLAFLACCMRDADLLTIYDRSEFSVRSLMGLHEEMNRTRELKGQPLVAVVDFLEGNRKFLEAAPMYTPYGIAMKEKHLEGSIQYFDRSVKQLLVDHHAVNQKVAAVDASIADKKRKAA